MLSTYLIKSPINWLMEDSDPVIQYLTRRDILEDSTAGDYDRLIAAQDIQNLIQNSDNGIIGNQSKFDQIYRGSMWYFAEAVEKGLDYRAEEIIKTADFIFQKAQLDSGGFTLQWKPEQAVACRTGDMVRFFLKARIDDERVEKALSWIESNQRGDGGWLHCPLSGTCAIMKLILFNRSGNVDKRERDPIVKSCFYATIACATALNSSKNDYSDSIERAASFFLKSRLFFNRQGEEIIPKKWWNDDFALLGVPVLSQYNILYGLTFLANSSYLNIRETDEAFNRVISKQNFDGTWNLETAKNGMLYGDDKNPPIGEKNKWVTLNVLRFLKKFI